MKIMQPLEKNAYRLVDNKEEKILRSREYKYYFNKATGLFIRRGKTFADDPQFSPFGPEILDMEIVVNGCPNACPWCYKVNSSAPPTWMPLDTFKQILYKMPNTLTQIAFGITGVQSNPDFVGIMEYTKSQGVIPNYTLTGIDLTDEIANATATLCGAVAVSVYPGQKDSAYDTVEWLTSLGMKQVNIHLLYYKENRDFVFEVLEDIHTDPRLSSLNAVVLLAFKPKGYAGNVFSCVGQEDFDAIVSFAITNKIPLGFDSCSYHKWARYLDELDITLWHKSLYFAVSEPCESGLFSSYINVKGEFFPCSFVEGEHRWEKGLSVLDCDDFLDDVWFNSKTVEWRDNLLENSRRCLVFDI